MPDISHKLPGTDGRQGIFKMSDRVSTVLKHSHRDVMISGSRGTGVNENVGVWFDVGVVQPPDTDAGTPSDATIWGDAPPV